MSIENVKAFVYQDVIDSKQSTNILTYPSEEHEDGFLEIEVSDPQTRKLTTYSYPLVSVWANSNKIGKVNIAKAIAMIPPKPKATVATKSAGINEEDSRLWEFANQLRMSGGAHKSGTPDMYLYVDRYCKVIRWGAETIPFRAQTEEYEPIPIYDSKGAAISDIIAQVKRSARSNTAAIVGMDVVNLGSISDSVLHEMGFVEVPDLLGRGVSMWQGDPVKSITGGTSSFSFANSYSNQIKDEVVDSFVKMLEEELNVSVNELNVTKPITDAA